MKKEKIMKIVIFVVVLLIPIIYSFFYLKSYWNPYNNLTGMKIAIVNLDEGKEGKEFVQSIEDSDVFNICEVNESEANDGMEKGEYYATITIPDNFTEDLESASSKEKQIAQITYSPSEATNYLATQIVNSAVKNMEISLEEKINGKVVENLSNKLEEVPDSLQKTSDGAKELLEGSKSLNSGLQQLNDGVTTLSDSYVEFDKGVNSASKGSKTLDSGISDVSSGVSSLNDGANSLDKAISEINKGVDELSTKSTSGITELTGGIEEINDGANTLNAGVSEYVDNSTLLIKGLVQTLQLQSGESNQATQELIGKANAFLKSEAGDTLKAGSQELCDGTQELKEGTEQLVTLEKGITSLDSAVVQVKDGTEQLKSGIGTLKTGAKSLKKGSDSLSTGLVTLSDSSSDVKSALKTLKSGTQTAADGSDELVKGVKEFDKEINEGISETKEELKNLDGMEEFAENPVDFNTEAYGKVESYGIAFTPLFLSIGLWVGALMCYVVFYYDQNNRFGILGSKGKNKFLQNLIYLLIGAIEGVLTGALLKLGLGYEVQNIQLYYVASSLIGITFMSIIQCLIRNFGDVGKFVALIILVLQLAASGGTFPVETISECFQPLTQYLPMTYSIKLLREILVPTATNLKGIYMAILMGITIVTIIITYIVDIIKSKRQVKEN